MFDQLRVVTPARWLADDLRRGAPTGLEVVHDLGLDVRASGRSVAWWMPHQFAARLAVTPGVPRVELTSPGPRWTAALDDQWTARRLWAGPLSNLGSAPTWTTRVVFAKPAEVKVASIPAHVWRSRGDFEDAAQRAGLGPQSWVQMSEPVAFTAEFRCFVVRSSDGRSRVVAASPYLVDGRTWDAWEDLSAAPSAAEAAGFAQRVLDAGVAVPAAFTLDVGVLDTGEWAVVEANAAWSSNPYHCDPVGVVEAILASQSGAPGRWAWGSDPLFVRRAARLGALPAVPPDPCQHGVESAAVRARRRSDTA